VPTGVGAAGAAEPSADGARLWLGKQAAHRVAKVTAAARRKRPGGRIGAVALVEVGSAAYHGRTSSRGEVPPHGNDLRTIMNKTILAGALALSFVACSKEAVATPAAPAGGTPAAAAPAAAGTVANFDFGRSI
jgi:hypothetical protein